MTIEKEQHIYAFIIFIIIYQRELMSYISLDIIEFFSSIKKKDLNKE
jgi:hypothetical protein